jgi:hypothetical protein
MINLNKNDIVLIEINRGKLPQKYSIVVNKLVMFIDL